MTNAPTPAEVFKNFAKSVDEATEVLKDSIPKLTPPKKPFVRPEHLMHRPFQQSDELRKLQSTLHREQNRQR